MRRWEAMGCGLALFTAERADPPAAFHPEHAAARSAAGDERVHVDTQVLGVQVVDGHVHELHHRGLVTGPYQHGRPAGRVRARLEHRVRAVAAVACHKLVQSLVHEAVLQSDS